MWLCALLEQHGIYRQSGTSYAAPQVAGVVALMRSVNQNLSLPQIETILKETSDVIPDAHLFPRSPSNPHRVGQVNAYNAVKGALCALPPATFSRVATADTTVYGRNLQITNTTVNTNRVLTVRSCSGVTINGNFTVQQGASLDIRTFSP